MLLRLFRGLFADKHFKIYQKESLGQSFDLFLKKIEREEGKPRQ